MKSHIYIWREIIQGPLVNSCETFSLGRLCVRITLDNGLWIWENYL